MTPAAARAVLLDLLRLPRATRHIAFTGMPIPAQRAILDEWFWQAHGGQIEPEAAPNGEPWSVWAIVAGRGFGKTRAGAEWVWARAREKRDARIALVGATAGEVAQVMIEGESGLLAVARCDEAPRWISSRGLFCFPSGAEARVFSAERPEGLRGAQHHFAWCDELGKWPSVRAGGEPDGMNVSRADAAWNNLMLGLRLGDRPRTIVTTTPRRMPLLTRILALPGCAQTHGRTDDNPHNAPSFAAAMRAMFAGTRLAAQELDGLILQDFKDALWTREIIEKARHPSPSPISGEGRLAEGERGEGTTWGREEEQSLTLPPACGRRAPPSPEMGEGKVRRPPPSPISGEGRLAERERGEGTTCGEAIRQVPHPPIAAQWAHGSPPRLLAGEGARRPISPEMGEGFTPPPMARIVIGLDPPASTGGDACGIVVCGKDADGIAWVLADLSAGGLSPEAWARRVAEAASLWGAGRVVAEKNQGGDMIASVLRAVDADLPVKLVAATKSKAARAEPIALRFETGRARLRGRFPELEDQLCALTWSGYHGPGSPDRADAMIWAMTALTEKEPRVPRVRGL